MKRAHLAEEFIFITKPIQVDGKTLRSTWDMMMSPRVCIYWIIEDKI